jgi:hypothetical protein
MMRPAPVIAGAGFFLRWRDDRRQRIAGVV